MFHPYVKALRLLSAIPIEQTATCEQKQKVVHPRACFWVKLRFHTDSTVQCDMCALARLCLWQLYPECLGLRSSYPTSAEMSDSKDLFEPQGDRSVHCEYASV